MLDMQSRPRRLRQNTILRDLIAETSLGLSHLIQPYFLRSLGTESEPISGFTGVSRWGVETLSRKIEADVDRGVKQFLLFGYAPSDTRDAHGTQAYHPESLLPQAVRKLRKRFGREVMLYTDVCLCPYTNHGHCGVIADSRVDNDRSVDLLAQMALVHAEAGVDVVAPSDMMDGRVGAIRHQLDQAGFEEVAILAYTAKYQSSYYGPFREALGSSPRRDEGAPSDRSSYQMDFRSSREAMRELELDIAEGADLVMVKPALAYLDIIQAFRQNSPVPVAAYCVSAEYEMVKRMAAAGLCDERAMTLENLYAIRRAGAHAIITYSASELAEKAWLK